MSNLAYQDEISTEILDGKIVAMSPRPAVNHNITIVNITRLFGNYLKGKPCTVFSDGVDVYLTEKDRVIPDAMIVCNKNIIRKKGVYGTPDLLVEVLSPGTAKNDRGYKKDLYERCGVKEYWIVETETLSIEVYLLKEDKFVLDEIYTVLPDYEIEDMTAEEKTNIKYEFKTSLYSDLIIPIDEIFEGRF